MDKILKIGSYVFISFLIIIISFTFGVPSFFSASSAMSEFVAAEVNGDTISKRELNSAFNNYKNRLGKDIDIPKEYLQKMKERILNSLINQKLLFDAYQKTHLIPTEKQSKKDLVDFLRTNFSQFISDKTGNFLFKKFKREVLDKYKISLDDLAKDSIKSKTMEANRQLLDSLQSVSKTDVYERLRLQDSWISYEVLQYTVEKKNTFLKKKINISFKEVKKRFEQEYKKTPGAELTDLKYQDISERLEKEKLASIEEDWDANFKKEIEKNRSLQFFQYKYGGLLFTIKKLSPLDSFSENASSKEASIRSMDKIFAIKESSFSAKLYQTLGPFYSVDGDIYIIRVTNRKLSKLPSVVGTSFDEKTHLSKLDELQSLQFETLIGEVREDNLDILFQSLAFYLIQHAKIVRNNSL